MPRERPRVRVRVAPHPGVRRVLRLLLLAGRSDVFEVQVETRQGPRTIVRREGEYFAQATRSKLLHDYALFGLDCWCHALDLAPGDVLLEVDDLAGLVAAGDRHWHAGDRPAAAYAYRRAADLGVLDAATYVRLARAMDELDDRVQARTWFELAKLRDPDDTEIRHHLARAYRRWGRATDAAAELIVVASMEGAPDSLLAFADACLDDDDLDGAELGYRAALAMTPGDAELHWVLANVLDDNGKSDEAADGYRRAREALRPDASLEHDVAVHHDRRGELDLAAAHLERALALQPDHERAALRLAHVRARQGRVADALALLRDLARRHPDDAEVLALLDALGGAGRGSRTSDGGEGQPVP